MIRLLEHDIPNSLLRGLIVFAALGLAAEPRIVEPGIISGTQPNREGAR